MIRKAFSMLNIVFLCFAFTNCGSKEHVHNYQLKHNSINHYYECDCSDIKDDSLHNFYWVVDVSPTEELDGIKHEECIICGYKQNEGTEIKKVGKIVEENIISNPASSINFDSFNEMKYILSNLKNNYKWLYINEIDDSDGYVNVYNKEYRYNYEKEIEEEYFNPYITISFSFYSEILGTDTEEEVFALYHSISFLYYIRPIDEINELNFEFYEYKNDTKYNNIIYIYSGHIEIGKVYYYTILDISNEWMEDFLNKNLKIL